MRPDPTATDHSDTGSVVNRRQRAIVRRNLTYANTFESPMTRAIIRSVEMLTGKLSIYRMIRKFERYGDVTGHAVWTTILEVMRIRIDTPVEQLAHIPKEGPVVVVANHPHGMVDGMVLAELIGRVRHDYRILTRSLLTDLDADTSRFLIPVPFPHQADAQERYVEMRALAMEHLKGGGLVALFPAGGVATSETFFGPSVEGEWAIFTAKMIRMSGATVVPLRFVGSNSRWYLMAHHISATLRQSLLVHEIVRAVGKPIAPVIGPPLLQEEVSRRITQPRPFMAWLRQVTLSLE